MPFDVDHDARIERLRRVNRHKLVQRELQAEEEEQATRAAVDHRRRVALREAALSEQLQEEQAEQIRKEKMIHLARERNPELRELSTKLRAAYTAKERQGQIAHHEALKRNEEVEKQHWMEMNKKEQEAYERHEAGQSEHRRANLQQQQRELEAMMGEKSAKTLTLKDEYLEERRKVDDIVAKVREQDYLEHLQRKGKQQATQAEHDEFLRMRDENKAREAAAQRAEEEAIRKFMAEQNIRRETDEVVRREREAAKAKLLEETSKKIQEEQRRKDELAELIDDLYTEQAAAKANAAAAADAARRQRDREMMIASNEEQKRLKEERKHELLREEQEFRRKMMEKFAEDDRIEEMNRMKRNQAKIEHAKKVAELIDAKRKLIEEDLAREAAIAAQARRQEEEMDALVQAEKERMLAEHAGNINQITGGPKGLCTTQRDAQIFETHKGTLNRAAEYRATHGKTL